MSHYRLPEHLTAAELGLFLGLTHSAIRTLIHRHGIKPAGKEGRANLYDARAFIKAVGAHDRRTARKRRRLVQQ